jgi:hypothetical protein
MEGRTSTWDVITAYVAAHSNEWGSSWTWVSTFAPGYTNIVGWTNAWNSMVANGATNVGFGTTNLYCQSNGVWVVFSPGGGGVGDITAAGTNTFTWTNTFTKPVVIATGTLSNHAARIDQVNSFWEQNAAGSVVLKSTLVYDRWWTTNTAGSVILQ